MPSISYAENTISYKIVYFGPSVAGKTTNLKSMEALIPREKRSILLTTPTEGESTMLLDTIKLDIGKVGGMDVVCRAFTVPGQVFYQYTQAAVLRGVDGIVFVADSNPKRIDANEISMFNLYRILASQQIKLDENFPLVIQYNKRDLHDALPLEVLDNSLNPTGFPTVQSVASNGENVLETLKLITRILINKGQ